MKKIILFTILTSLLISCGVTKSNVRGVENQAFLLILGTPSKYPNGVKVVIDDKTRFNSEVQKNRDKVKHLRLYGISTGKHKISISQNNKTIYEKIIFLSSQQTKKIILPWKKYIYLFIIAFAFSSCSAPKGLYSWGKYQQASYNYLKKADEKSVDKIMKEYQKIIKKQKGIRKVTPPGIFADYGFFLIQRGDLKAGKANLNKEISLYPESKIFIDRILKLLE